MKFTACIRRVAPLIIYLAVSAASFADDLSKAEVKSLQQNLNKIGLNVGTADGIAGKRTKAAIHQLNIDHTGIPNSNINKEVLELSKQIAANRFDPPQPPAKNSIFGWERDDVHIDLSQHRNPCLPEKNCEPTDVLLAALDLDLDGDKDLVYGTYYFFGGENVRSGKPLILLQNDGRGRFSEFSTGPELDLAHVREALVADFDGDGHDDLFLLDHGMDAKPFPGAQNLLVLARAGGPIDVTAQNMPSREDFSHGGAAGDLDGDGDTDILVIANESQVVSHNSYILENDGTGKFSVNDRPDYIDFSLLDIRSRGRDYGLNNTAKIADFDLDGNLDIAWLASGDSPKIAATKPGARYTHITFGNSAHQYLSENTVELPLKRWGHKTFVTDLKHVDFDGDGDLDLLATSNTRHNFNPWRGAYIDLIENMGERKYKNMTHKHLFSQGYPDLEDKMWNHWIYPVDFDLDGSIDFAVLSLDPLQKKRGSLEGTTVKIAVQTKDARFLPLSSSGISSKEYTLRRIMPVDVDGDGDFDLVGSRLLRSFDYEGDDLVFTGFIVQVVENLTVK